MKQPFGILVERAEALTHPVQGILLTGPGLGGPEVGQRLTIRGAFSRPSRTTVRSVVSFHRTEISDIGILISIDSGVPASFRGAVLYEEGMLFRVFSGFITRRPTRTFAQYVLRNGHAHGFLRIERGILDAFILGGGLSEGVDLWQELVEIKYGERELIKVNEIRPFGPAWLVPTLFQYRRGNHTAVLASFCGPASPNYPLLSIEEDNTSRGYVMTQQSNGCVQIDVDRKLRNLPCLAGGTPWVNQPDGGIYEYA